MADCPKGAILRPDEIGAADRGNGARTIPLVHSGLDARRLINVRTIFSSGAKIPLHSYTCEESVLVLRRRKSR